MRVARARTKSADAVCEYVPRMSDRVDSPRMGWGCVWWVLSVLTIARRRLFLAHNALVGDLRSFLGRGMSLVVENGARGYSIRHGWGWELPSCYRMGQWGVGKGDWRWPLRAAL